MRNSLDTTDAIKGYEVGAEVKFKAGYKIWATATGGDSISSAYTANWVTFVVQEKSDDEDSAIYLLSGAVALAASLMAF